MDEAFEQVIGDGADAADDVNTGSVNCELNHQEDDSSPNDSDDAKGNVADEEVAAGVTTWAGDATATNTGTNNDTSIDTGAVTIGQRMLWTQSQARHLFQHHRVWPSFCGALQDHNAGSLNGTEGAYPVILWPEQHAYISSREAANLAGVKRPSAATESTSSSSSSSSTSSSTKRQACEVADRPSSKAFVNSSQIGKKAKADLRADAFRYLTEKSYFVGPGDVYGTVLVNLF
jgi:hypothetical protein